MSDNSCKGIFVAGTDTDIGKTVLSAALVSVFRSAGIDAVPMKPVQTGCTVGSGEMTAPDLEFCLSMGGVEASLSDRESMAPYRFEDACSPHLAAKRAGVNIAVDRIIECFRTLEARHDLVVVEGAGGILVPIDEKKTMLDVMTSLALPVILVSRPGLGTINHTLLSLQALKQRDLPVAGIIFNEAQPASLGYIEEDNYSTIERMGEAPVLARFPFMPELDAGKLTSEEFAGLCTRHLSHEDVLQSVKSACP